MQNADMVNASIRDLQRNAQELFKTVGGIDLEAPMPQAVREAALHEKATAAYVEAMTAALKAADIINAFSAEKGAGWERRKELNEEASGVELAAEFDAETGGISCRILSPPQTKNMKAKHRFFELICLDLEREIVNVLPPDFKKISSAYVVFVNHFKAELQAGKQPYFDNDNLAIKGILDAVVPYVCYDDAAKFCDNLYLAQVGDSSYTELHIVPKGRLDVWLHKHRELSFAQEIAEGNQCV